MDLPQQEGSKRFAGLTVEIVTSGIVAGSLLAVESELATLMRRCPAGERELMPAVLKADFDGVLSLDPGEIVGELPAVVGQESEFPPTVLIRWSCRVWCPGSRSVAVRQSPLSSPPPVATAAPGVPVPESAAASLRRQTADFRP